jgi:hypothetical protein
MQLSKVYRDEAARSRREEVLNAILPIQSVEFSGNSRQLCGRCKSLNFIFAIVVLFTPSEKPEVGRADVPPMH